MLPIDNLLRILGERHLAGRGGATSTELARSAGASPATTKRWLELLVRAGKVIRTGKARATRYALVDAPQQDDVGEIAINTRPGNSPVWSAASLSLRELLARPLAARDTVTYQRRFIDDYRPNQTFLLPESLARELAAEGRLSGQQPAGTYARKVLEQLLVDLSWSSSRLEGNRYTLLATQELFSSGMSKDDPDTVMLLNHKRAIEFLVDAVRQYGLTGAVIRNLHALLMQDLSIDTSALGAIRQQVVNITDTLYLPTQIPLLLEEMFGVIIEKARLVKNPLEAAFFLWIHLAYLQPFEDGNKRTSRLAANVPLMLYNCAPLSFLDVELNDYASAMIGVYEYLDVSMATDLFAWTYRRSLKKYAVVVASMGTPDPLRLRYRETLNDVIGRIVRERKTLVEAMAMSRVTAFSDPEFEALLLSELQKLDANNCARYRLTMSATEAWIDAGRPR